MIFSKSAYNSKYKVAVVIETETPLSTAWNHFHSFLYLRSQLARNYHTDRPPSGAIYTPSFQNFITP
uniref:Uncharacterized protein n=1 Tax=Rhizophagus irregularis (strain DAOM 181602 / DAOM 197198 / MUCL 43194) TaxID=747089 RepID=U9T7U5_RHIID